MKKPRIAFIMPDKIEKPVGGMGVQAKYIIKNLEKEFDFDIYAFPEDNKVENYHSCYSPLPRVMHHGILTIGGQIAYLTEIIKNEKPDIIHVADYTLYLAGVMASRAFNIPLVVSVQLSAHFMEKFGITFARDINSIDGMAIQNTIKEIELLGLMESDKIIHVSQVYKDIFKKELPHIDSKSFYIPNGIDLKEYSKTNPKYKKLILPGERRIKLVYIGRFAQQKNIANLNQAEIPKNIDLIFVGPEETNNSDFHNVITSTNQVENKHYYGPAYDEEKINLLHSADAVIIPSLHECHPIVMHEAMAAGCVILHSGAGDMQNILTEDFAINCGKTKESIEAALIKLSAMSNEELEERKNKGLEVVKNYTWEKSSEKTKEVYDEVLKNKS